MVSTEEITQKQSAIRQFLCDHGIEPQQITTSIGPTVSLFKLRFGPKVRLSSLLNLQDDLAWYLKFKGVRMIGLDGAVGIEIANDTPEPDPFDWAMEKSRDEMSRMILPVILGTSYDQHIDLLDLAYAPHLLVAGATKQGKTEFLRTLLASLLSDGCRSEVKFQLFNPMGREFSSIKETVPVFYTLKQSLKGLQALCDTMERRLSTPSEKAARLVVLVDEYADLTRCHPDARQIYACLIRLLQNGHRAGIHLVLSTQRPSADVITMLIKSNITARIAFRTASKADSRVILDSDGAERLIGSGDMLFALGGSIKRIQTATLNESI